MNVLPSYHKKPKYFAEDARPYRIAYEAKGSTGQMYRSALNTTVTMHYTNVEERLAMFTKDYVNTHTFWIERWDGTCWVRDAGVLWEAM